MKIDSTTSSKVIKKMQYRIEWISKLTKVKGNGSWYSPSHKSMLEESVKYMNDKYLGEIHHWIKMIP